MTVVTKEQRDKWKDANPLRTYRARNDLSLMAMAAQLQSSVSAVQQWESGAATPSADKMSVLAAAMALDVDDLTGLWDRWLRRQPRNAA